MELVGKVMGKPRITGVWGLSGRLSDAKVLLETCDQCSGASRLGARLDT